MKGKTKGWLIAGAALVFAGIIMFSAVMSAYGWDFYRLNTVEYKTDIYSPDKQFNDIYVKAGAADISFIPSDYGEIKVVCTGESKVKYSAEVKDGKLVIDTADSRRWYDCIGINFGSSEIAVFMPEGQYGALSVKSTAGNVKIPKDFKFESIDISGSTGNITNGASALNSIKIKTSTGNVKFDGCDSEKITVKTSTGSITGSLLGNKIIKAESSTGDIDVPKSSDGGLCSLTTSTGDIKINID